MVRVVELGQCEPHPPLQLSPFGILGIPRSWVFELLRGIRQPADRQMGRPPPEEVAHHHEPSSTEAVQSQHAENHSPVFRPIRLLSSICVDHSYVGTVTADGDAEHGDTVSFQDLGLLVWNDLGSHVDSITA